MNVTVVTSARLRSARSPFPAILGRHEPLAPARLRLSTSTTCIQRTTCSATIDYHTPPSHITPILCCLLVTLQAPGSSIRPQVATSACSPLALRIAALRLLEFSEAPSSLRWSQRTADLLQATISRVSLHSACCECWLQSLLSVRCWRRDTSCLLVQAQRPLRSIHFSLESLTSP